MLLQHESAETVDDIYEQYCIIKTTLMKDSDQYFTMIFGLIARAQEEQYVEVLPETKAYAFKFMENSEEIYVMVFYRMLTYFLNEEKMKDLLDSSRKNLKQMLDNLQDNLEG